MKTLIWDRGTLIPVKSCIEEFLRLHDDNFWNAAAGLSIQEFSRYLGEYMDILDVCQPRIRCAEITDTTTVGEYEGHDVIAQREGDYIYVYLHKFSKKVLVLYMRCDHLIPTITFEGSEFVWDIYNVYQEFWKEYAWRLWDKWRNESGYIPLDDVSVIDVEIRNMMEEERWRCAMLFADCVCQMAMAKGDLLMHDYFAKIRDGLRQVLLTD